METRTHASFFGARFVTSRYFLLTTLVVLFSALSLNAWGQTTTYTQLTSIAEIDESAQYVLGVNGTGFHYSGTSSWGLVSKTETPLYYTLKKAADGKSFTAKTTVDSKTYYLQIPTSNGFSMSATTGTNTDIIIGTTTVSGTNYAVANKTTTARHLRINGTSGLRSYAGTTGTMAYFYKVSTGTSYAVTWANGGHGTAPTSPVSASSLTLPTITETGYTNTGWTASEVVKVNGSNVAAGTLIPCGTTVTLTKATNFTAQWEVTTYTINLISTSNGSPVSCYTPGSMTIQYNATSHTTFIPPTRDGYVISDEGFWTAPSGGTHILNKDGSFYSNNITGFVTGGKWTNTSTTLNLYPHWANNCDNNITLSVNVSGGHGTATANKTSISTCSCTQNDRLVKITATPETGYVIDNITWTTTSGTVTATKQSGNSGTNTWSFYFAQDNAGEGYFTVTFIEKPQYTITWNNHGETSTTVIDAGSAVGTLPSTPTSCDATYNHFEGWFTSPAGTVDAPSTSLPGTIVTTTTKPGGNVTYYAVYSTGSGGSGSVTWNKVSDLSSLKSSDVVAIGTYHATNGTYIMSNDKGTGAAPTASKATTSADRSKITSEVGTAYQWNIAYSSGNLTIYPNGSTTTWLYCTNDNNGVRVGTNANKVYTVSSNYLKNTATSRYIGVYNTSNFRCYTSSSTNIGDQTFVVYKKTGGAAEKYISTCSDPTTWTVKYDPNGKELSPGSSEPSASTGLSTSEAFTLPTNNFYSSPEYVQVGWNTDASATSTLTSIPAQTAGTVVTLYAIWQKSQVEVVEVTRTNDIIIEHNFGENTDVQLDKWSTIIQGETAKDIFFSKYFEAAYNVKLISIFNGTGEEKDISDLRIHIPWQNWETKYQDGSWVNVRLLGYKDRYVNLDTLLANRGRSNTLKNGEELIIYSWQPDKAASGSCYRDQDILNKAESLADRSNWIPITYDYDETDGGGQAICFSGKEPVVLERKAGSTWTPIDIIGAMDASKHAIYPTTTPSWGDAEGWICSGGKNLKDTTGTAIQLSTNRCLLVRKFSVLDGSKAVASNIGNSATFATLCNEWYGYHVNYDKSQSSCYETDNQNSAEGFGYVGAYDYNSSYEKYTVVEPDEFSATTNDDGTVTIHIDPTKVDGGLASLSCDMLKIKVTDNTTGDVLGQVEYKVPIIVTASGTETNNEIFMKFDDCSTCDVAILQDATLAPNASGRNVVRDLEIYRGAKLNVPTGKTLTVNNLVLRSKGDVTPQADIQGTLNRKDTKLYFDKRIDETRWYWMTLPYDCNVADVTFRNGDKPTYGVGKDWVLKTYNGVKRANTQAGGCWEVFNGETIQKGVGYILGVTPKAGHAFVEIRFPMTATQWDKNRATITVPVTPTAKDGITPNHVGWNLVGNPYLTNYTAGHIGESGATNLIPLGLLQENAEHEFERVGSTRYVVIPQGGGYSEYQQVAIGSQELPTFMSYFIQIDGNVGTNYAVDFKYANSMHASPARRAPEEYAEEEDNHIIWVPVTITNVLDEQDETTLLISNQFTNDYDLMDDLVKWRGDYYQYPQITTKPVLASRNTAGEMAFNALPDSTALQGVPLNYYAANEGMYTIALSDKYGTEEIAEASLFDATTNQWYNILNEPYIFSSKRTDDQARFTLSVRVNRREVPTALDTQETDNSPRKVLYNGHVYIIRGGKVYDITGKELMNR